MNAQELRIGNWVDFVSTPGQYEQVTSVTIEAGPDINRVDIKDIVGIPLTVEILEKAGFSKNDYMTGYMGIRVKAGGMYTEFVLNIDDEITFPVSMGRIPLIRSFEYLHDLQNFFYSFWETELIVDLNA